MYYVIVIFCNMFLCKNSLWCMVDSYCMMSIKAFTF